MPALTNHAVAASMAKMQASSDFDLSDKDSAWARQIILKKHVEPAILIGLDLQRCDIWVSLQRYHSGDLRLGVAYGLHKYDDPSNLGAMFTYMTDKTKAKAALPDDHFRRLLRLQRIEDVIPAHKGPFVMPDWAYETHPIVARHLALAGITGRSLVSAIGTNRFWRTVASRSRSRSSVLPDNLGEQFRKLGNSEGRIEAGLLEVRKLELDRQAFFVADHTYGKQQTSIMLPNCILPELVKSQIVGQPVYNIVNHPSLDVPGMEILSVRQKGKHTLLVIPTETVLLSEWPNQDSPMLPLAA